MVGVGSTVGNYEVLEKLGEGAMGTVWLARHPEIGKRVALKVIRAELSDDEEALARFFNEARAVTLIGHVNIVDVKDFGQTPAGESFIVMELLEGRTLAHALRDGEMSIARVVDIALQMADGLEAAHVRGIVHRDLKPDNVFLTRRSDGSDHVKILDFGLAKLTGPGVVENMTRTGTLLGTARYMPPEAAEGSRHVDHRGDVYALGCMLFELVTGTVPFPGEGFGEVLVRHVRDTPETPSRLRPGVPPWLDKIVLHALAKKREHRFQSMAALGAALRDPVRWARGIDGEEVVQRTRILPAPSPVVHARPSREARTVLASERPTRISEPERTAPRQDLLPAVLFAIAILALAGIVGVRIRHRPTAAPTPAAVVPLPTPSPEPTPPPTPTPMPSPEPMPMPMPEPSPIPTPSPKPHRSHTAPRPPAYRTDGALLAPSW